MRKYISLSVFLLLILVTVVPMGKAMDLTLSKDSRVQVYFSPRGECTEAIISEIDQSKTEILVQAYSFTSSPIAKALASANKRGVKVQAILDKSQRSERYTSATFLSNTSIPTYIDDKHAIAHNKIMIIDKARVITGSFNFTKAAEERNAENLLVISSKELASYYLDNWQKHREHSVPYGRL